MVFGTKHESIKGYFLKKIDKVMVKTTFYFSKVESKEELRL